MTGSPTPEEDADSTLEVVAAGICVAETSSLLSAQELMPISERHTTATSSFEILRSCHNHAPKTVTPPRFVVTTVDQTLDMLH